MEEDADAGGVGFAIEGGAVAASAELPCWSGMGTWSLVIPIGKPTGTRAPLSDKNIDLNGIIQYPRKPCKLRYILWLISSDVVSMQLHKKIHGNSLLLLTNKMPQDLSYKSHYKRFQKLDNVDSCFQQMAALLSTVNVDVLVHVKQLTLNCISGVNSTTPDFTFHKSTSMRKEMTVSGERCMPAVMVVADGQVGVCLVSTQMLGHREAKYGEMGSAPQAECSPSLERETVTAKEYCHR
ncbi:hypothetical protein E5288_WYG010585 [Bos mutus]|uniref:Uncharacterized protein n=1 Tax=Bos mutus TaxID=72004 RepID=A0A6B0S7W1_9CETA|nr:hypothetical protein [Bos mutus]